jgi:hypothetical protein
MRLVHRSRRAADPVRHVSAGGELFVASVVVCMLLAAFGDAVDPAWLGEAGLDFVLFDFGGEISVLAMRHWTLLQLLMAGGAIAAGIAILKTALPAYLRSPRPGPHRVMDKVPIELRPKTF